MAPPLPTTLYLPLKSPQFVRADCVNRTYFSPYMQYLCGDAEPGIDNCPGGLPPGVP